MRPGDLGSVTSLFGSTPEARLALIRAVWPRVVGEQVARRTEVASITGNFLRLRVTDPRWRKVLPRMRQDILAHLRQAIGGLAPHQIGLLEGDARRTAQERSDSGRPIARSREAAALPAATPPSRALVEASHAIADADLRAEFLATAARYLAVAALRANDASDA
jgi:hypothetical protein